MFLRTLALVAALLAGIVPAQASSTFSSLPPATQPVGSIPDAVPMDQGSGCQYGTPPCATVQSPSTRLGQPLATNCANILAPFQYQQCFNTTTAPPTLQVYIGTQWVSILTVSGQPPVANNAALQALPTPASGITVLTRQGFLTPGDSPPLYFKSSPSACSLNSGQGDGGSQVPSANGTCWLAIPPDGVWWVTYFGAKCDGVTDDTNPITAAIAAAKAASTSTSAGTVEQPGVPCRSNSGIVVPPNVNYQMATFFRGNPATGAALECPNTVTICLQFTGGAGLLGTTQLSNVTVVGLGTPTAGEIGIQFYQGYAISASNVNASNFDTCMSWKAQGVGGIAFTGANINTSKCQTHFYNFDSWPEAQITGGRAGLDGPGDYTGTKDFVSITQQSCTSGGCGPNGITFLNYQFNGGGSVGCAINWNNFAGSASASMGAEIRFDNVHFEYNVDTGITNGLICSDSSVAMIDEFYMRGTEFVAHGATSVFTLNSNTALSQWWITDNDFGCGGPSGLTLTPTPISGPAFNSVHFANNFGCSQATFASNGVGVNSLFLTKNTWGNALTISGAWNPLAEDNDTFGITLNDTATGRISYTNNYATPWVPALAFGGASTGITYSGQGGFVTRTPNGGFKLTFGITLTNVGSATGAATIAGLQTPFACGSGFISGGVTMSNASGLSNTVMTGLTNTNPATLQITQGAAAGTSSITNSNFTNSTILTGSAECLRTL